MTEDEALQTLDDLENFLDNEWSKTTNPETLALIEKLLVELSEIRRRAER